MKLTKTEKRVLTDVKYGISTVEELVEKHNMRRDQVVNVLRSLRYKNKVEYSFEGDYKPK